MDFSIARRNMVDSQVRPNDVTDPGILRAMQALPRESFVPPEMRPLAYMDLPIRVTPSGDAPRSLMSPVTLARLIQALAPKRTDRVLDVGCATGYGTAILAGLVDEVVGLESDAGLAAEAAERLATLGIRNAAVVTGPLTGGFAEKAPYDAILINGSVTMLTQSLEGQLRHGGRISAVIARPGQFGTARVFHNVQGEISSRPVFDASAPALPGFEPEVSFAF